MFKQPLLYSFTYVLLFSGLQFLFRDEVTWVMNLLIGLSLFIGIHFIKCCMVPYDWNKHKKPQG
ncbi:hypothetical protein [Alkalihalophilus marmarensis]|uniref:hypothetical protein n=1 Tax=Alkalihalophilus marmarensis TaxID=521377 RepID=UPI002DBAEFC6|nr:hypothetical protein [Alkalihalophilus marmarensis]MEC2072518.1 hypothetical protein [Alkalihalophilus marmarensis]